MQFHNFFGGGFEQWLAQTQSPCRMTSFVCNYSEYICRYPPPLEAIFSVNNATLDSF
jgi:hypothetical protein